MRCWAICLFAASVSGPDAGIALSLTPDGPGINVWPSSPEQVLYIVRVPTQLFAKGAEGGSQLLINFSLSFVAPHVLLSTHGGQGGAVFAMGCQALRYIQASCSFGSCRWQYSSSAVGV